MCKKCIITSLIIFLTIAFSALFFVLNANAQEKDVVVINEIAWMGTEKAWQDQWIELHNPTEKDIDLEGWFLKSKEDKERSLVDIELKGIIESKGYFLAVRREENSYIQQPADIQGYSGNLNNDGETIVLKNPEGKTIDKVDGWHAGDNDTKATMERINPLKPGTDPANWTDGPPHGTPGATNRKLTAADIPKTNDIVINELIPNPEGPDHENEWIELHNKGNESHNIKGWTIHGHKIKEVVIIPPSGFYLIERSDASYILRDTGDTVNLKHPDGTVMDTVSYDGPAEEGVSYARFSNGWYWTDNPSPNGQNTLPSQAFMQQNQTNTQDNKESKKKENNAEDKNKKDDNKNNTTATTVEPQNLLAQTHQDSLFNSQSLLFAVGIIISLLASVGIVFTKKKIG